MVEEGHRRSIANHGFTHIGKDGKERHGLRVKMQHVDLIVFQHCVEEGGERRDQAGPKGVDEERDLGGCPVNTSMRCRLGHHPSPLIEARGEHGTHHAHGLIVEHQRSANCGLDGRGALAEDRGFFPLSACFGAMAME